MTALRLAGLAHAYDGREVLGGIDLAVPKGEILCLLGPSGCGKSTLLRLVAGLEPLQAGRIEIGGEIVADAARTRPEIPPERRDVGFVFQDFALFPHLSVIDNVAFGIAGVPPAGRREAARAMLDLLGMAQSADAFPHTLSGGQQQRVALARALARKPRLLLLDEPFSGLDAGLRGRLRDDTLHMLKASGIAAVMVTHDAEEAMYLGDRIAVMREGRLVQAGRPADLYRHPVDAFVASFFGDINRLTGRVEAGAVPTPFGCLPALGLADGTAAQILIRPEGLSLGQAGQGPLARVEAARPLGPVSLVHLEVPVPGAPLHLHARLPGDDPPPEGAEVTLRLDPAKAFVFPG